MKNYQVLFTLVKLGFILEAKRYKEILDSKILKFAKSKKPSTDFSDITSRKASDSTQTNQTYVESTNEN